MRVGPLLIVSDSNVDPLHGDRCEDVLRRRGLTVSRAVVPAGESSKSLERLAGLYETAVAAGLDRSSLVVALGGGMVGDLAGFLAATFLRGIGVAQVPTTLLAMVDSSVGGKTAVNLPQGKNLVGAFHQPVEVAADITTLRTLPDREYVSGLAEVVKYGVIWDAAFFELLERNVERLLSRDEDLLEEIVARCCEIKAEVVAVDELEAGARAILNFGHTLGHALEGVAGYGRWLHGEAVAAGMEYAARLSCALRGFPEEEERRLAELLSSLGLERACRAARRGGESSWPDLRQAMSADKKTRRGALRLVLAERLGSVVFGCEPPEEVLEEAYSALVRDV